MIFFHGTIEENVKKIRKNGILDLTTDQWIMEVTKKNVCCISSQPTSGEGGNASFFAYRHPKSKIQDGYLIVLKIDEDIFNQKLITIFDNKVLDDYVKHHFFVREEFRAVGFLLYKAMTEYRNKDRYFKQLDNFFNETDTATDIFYGQDQKEYYRELYDTKNRKNFQLLDLVVTDEFAAFLHAVGKWQPVYEFLESHFGAINEEKYTAFLQKTIYDNNDFWTAFYSFFPQKINEEKYEYFRNWFSSKWLEAKQTKEITKNSQILMEKIEPEHIKGFIKITTPSGFADRFRSCRSKSNFAKEVWKEALKIAKD